jgi:drug/metabolite transporter (DMT)-like permease
MLSGCVAFALMASIAHALRTSCDWRIITLARTGLALVFAAILAGTAGVQLVLWRSPALWIRSIAGSLSLVGTFYAYTQLPVSDVLTLTNLFPIWVAILSWPVLGKPPAVSVWIAVMLSVIGVVLIQQPHFAPSQLLEEAIEPALHYPGGGFATLIAVASSFFTAAAMLGLHRLAHLDPRAIVVHFSATALLFCLASFVVFDRGPLFEIAPIGPLAVALLAIGVTATIGQLYLTKAFAAGPPAQVSVVGLSQILFAMAIEVLYFGRSIGMVTLIGMALIIVPTAWVMIHDPR